MDNNLNSGQINKKIINSPILGIISILLSLGGGVFRMFLVPEGLSISIGKSWFELIFLFYLGVFVVAVWGLIKGFKELKLSKKQGIIGIVLSLVGLVLTIIVGAWLEFYTIMINT